MAKKTAGQIASEVAAAEAAVVAAEATKNASRVAIGSANVRIDGTGRVVVEARGPHLNQLVLEPSDAATLRDLLIEWFPVN